MTQPDSAESLPTTLPKQQENRDGWPSKETAIWILLCYTLVWMGFLFAALWLYVGWDRAQLVWFLFIPPFCLQMLVFACLHLPVVLKLQKRQWLRTKQSVALTSAGWAIMVAWGLWLAGNLVMGGYEKPCGPGIDDLIPTICGLPSDTFFPSLVAGGVTGWFVGLHVANRHEAH